jgi:hypothetical protein
VSNDRGVAIERMTHAGLALCEFQTGVIVANNCFAKIVSVGVIVYAKKSSVFSLCSMIAKDCV